MKKSRVCGQTVTVEGAENSFGKPKSRMTLGINEYLDQKEEEFSIHIFSNLEEGSRCQCQTTRPIKKNDFVITGE